MWVGRNGHRCHRQGERDGNKPQRRNLSAHPLLIWCQEQTGNSQNVSLCFSSSISMPFSELLASNKSYENLFLNHLLIPAFSEDSREKKQSREQVLGAGEALPAFQCLSRKEDKGGVWSWDIQITSLEPLRNYSFWKGMWT